MITQPSTTRVDLWVFRDGRKAVPMTRLLSDLTEKLQKIQYVAGDAATILDALIRAGEMESALADQGSSLAGRMAGLTDALAWHLVKGSARANYGKLLLELQQGDSPRTLQVSPPEGFSYYGLNPKDFIELARGTCFAGDQVAVIGIRSIGITLSAVVAAALSTPESLVDRISVRPSGHPYDRVAGFSADQARWIEQKHSCGSQFLIVDEGPGRSGSTFLSVAEALVGLGVPTGQLTLLGTRQPQEGELCATNADARWKRFRFFPVEAHSSERFRTHRYIGGGEWRKTFLDQESSWPACWPQMERSKFLSPDGEWLFKFEGMGRIGEEVRARALALAQTGFGCEMQDALDGYSAYRIVQGGSLSTTDISDQVLQCVARYCAMRDLEFKVQSFEPDPLAEMVRFNVRQEFGVECSLSNEDLAITNPVVTDGRMQLHEWLREKSGKILKSDASSHGDDHFFPGPVDIAWDLAGAIIEWNLGRDAVKYLLDHFHQISGRRLHRTIGAFSLAYAIFRMGICRMAVPTTDIEEQRRLQRDYARYRRKSEQLLAQFSKVSLVPSVGPTRERAA